MTDYPMAGKGLNRMFIGEILCILAIIPLIGGILALAGYIVMLVGLYTAGKADDGYRTAFFLTIASLILGFIPVLSLIGSVFNIITTYLVCTTTARLLMERGDTATAARGLFIWKLYAACLVVSLVCALLLFVPIINVAALLLELATAIASLVGGILYLMFLYRASDSLGY